MVRPVTMFACVCIGLGLVPAAQAQPQTGTVSVGAAAFADIRRAPSTEIDLSDVDDDTSGTVAGGGLSLGVHLTRRLSVRAEWTLSDTLSTARDVGIYPYTVRDLVTSLLPGGTSLVAAQDITEKRDVKVGAALLGFHLGGRRASVELLGGLGLVNERVTVISDLRLSPLQVTRALTVPAFRNEVTTSAHHPVAIVGADVAVALASHAALVPQIRAYALDGALQVRPGLGLRWTF